MKEKKKSNGKGKKFFKIVFGIVLILLCVNIIIKYPVHRYMGFNRMYKYMDMQNISRDDIKEVDAFRSTKSDRYEYWVVLKDMPEYRYEYYYYLKGDKMYSEISKKNNDVYDTVSIEKANDLKYKPLNNGDLVYFK